MSAAEKLKALERDHVLSGLKVVPIYRKTGSKVLGAEAFTRARDVESVMDALPQIRALVEAAQKLRNDARGGLVDDPFHSRGEKLDDALAALDEALTTKGER